MKMLGRKVTIFPFSKLKTNTKYKDMPEVQTPIQSYQICQNSKLKIFGLPPFHMEHTIFCIVLFMIRIFCFGMQDGDQIIFVSGWLEHSDMQNVVSK